MLLFIYNYFTSLLRSVFSSPDILEILHIRGVITTLQYCETEVFRFSDCQNIGADKAYF